MTRVLVSFPGRSGDLLWALPAIRALSEQHHIPISLVISGKYGSLAPLIRLQPYIAQCLVDPHWVVVESAPMTPREPPQILGEYDHIYHLGYEGWPSAPLPFDIAKRAGVEIDLHRPWITAPTLLRQIPVSVGFTDEHFELKYGLWALLTRQNHLSGKQAWQSLSGAPGSRWATEGGHWCASWEIAASLLHASRLFFGCCSALHVLACAVGTPCVVMEPAEARWHPIFWPYGQEGPQVTLVRGGDGRQTFDARHCGELIQAALGQQQEAGE